MRAASRLLAAVKSVRYLEAGTPTGLTGLLTHQSPRSTLIYLYSSTLDKLKRIPDTSVYRQSTEALTRQRLALVESFVPEGLEAWQERLKKQMEEHPGLLERDGASVTELKDGSTLVRLLVREESGDEWDGEDARPEPEGERSESERKRQWEGVDTSNFEEELRSKDVKLEMEPPLTAEQISELENKLGAGLIEEVIQVAEGEDKLVDKMIEARVWEDLEVKPAEGQWAYHERASHTATQKP